MTGGIIKSGKCVNVIQIKDTASLLRCGAVEVPVGYGIGDFFDGDKWEKKSSPDPEPTTDEQIAALKAEIADTDYQIIKAYEYALVGLEVEYDIATLHADRQGIRDEINELEEQPNE